MDPRLDTSSGRYIEQWSFLTSSLTQDQARSLPPSSSYLRSDQSNVSPLPTTLHFQQLNASRSSLTRRAQTPSIGGHSSTTIPSQPVLHRVHSDNVSSQNRPPIHFLRPKLPIMKDTDLPPLQEFTFHGILTAIREDIEPHLDATAEILGRSRLVLADQHDSHLPPQGEIRAPANGLHAVAEASASNERLAATDDVLIAREDASLIDGSIVGSAIYGFLDRLHSLPVPRRIDGESTDRPVSASAVESIRDLGSILEPYDTSYEEFAVPLEASPPSQTLLPEPVVIDEQAPLRNTMVSEIFISPSANALILPDRPATIANIREEPQYGYEYGIYSNTRQHTLRDTMSALVPTSMISSMSSWVRGQPKRPMTAEAQLRQILERHPHQSGIRSNRNTLEEGSEMYQ